MSASDQPPDPPGPDSTSDPFGAAPDAAPSTDPASALILTRAAELVALKRETEDIEERLAVIEKQRKRIEAFLLEAFAENPKLRRLHIDGRTVYLRRQLWANAKDKAAAHEALIAAGLGEYATKGFNTNSVSALYREWERDGVAPPPELAGVITTGERFNIGVTK